jgi:hypothetical protein
MSGLRRGVWGRFIRLPDSRKAPRVAVKWAGTVLRCCAAKAGGNSGDRRGAAGEQPGAKNPGSRGGTQSPYSRRTTGWTQRSRLAALCPQARSNGPSPGGSPPAGVFARLDVEESPGASAARADRRQQEGRKDRHGAERQYDPRRCNPARSCHESHRAPKMRRRYSK